MKRKRILEVIPLALVGFGMVMICSSTLFFVVKGRSFTPYLFKVFIHVFLGVSVFYLVSRMKLSFIERISPLVLGFSILLLVLVVVAGKEVNAAKRWLAVPGSGFTFQPSEFAKLSLILYLARYLSRKSGEMRKPRNLLFPLGIIFLVSGLILLEPNYSVSVLTLCLGLLMLYLGGANPLHILMVVVLFVPLGLIHEHVRERIQVFINGNVPQVRNSMVALGSGGIFGVGLGRGKEKLLFIPCPHTDFIFSVVGEELGFMGTFGLMVVFLLYFINSMRASMDASLLFSKYAGCGLSLMIFLHFLFHAGVVTGILPPTGIPLPFISYGGSALMVNLAGAGIILSIARGKG